MFSQLIANANPELGERFNRWILDRVRQRRGAAELPLTFEYRHVYVMPTRFGFWFGILLALVALGGLNFNNNMALMMGFLLVSLAQLTTLLAYRNLAGITVQSITADPVFAGEAIRFRAVLKNSEERNRFAVQAVSSISADCADLEADTSVKLVLEQPAEQRGWTEMDPFRVENRYPLGLFRAWSVIIPQARCLVYPRPAVNPPPLPRSGQGEFGAHHKGEGEHLHGLREYKPGDPLRRIAWRASARQQKLYAREMESPVDEACELNWYLMRGGSAEEKLSILTAWILRAERRQISYSLEMPGAALPAGLGEDHRNACLRVLALFRS